MDGIIKYCDSCNEPILDLYYHTIAQKFYLHLKCLKCSNCHKNLKKKCFILNGKFLCARDYAKLQLNQQKRINPSRICKFCQQSIQPRDLVIRLNEFDVSHLNCFNCTKCSKHIDSGQKYGLFNDQLFCEKHYIEEVSSITYDYTTTLSSTESSPFSNNNENLSTESPYPYSNSSTMSCIHERAPLVNYNNQQNLIENYEETCSNNNMDSLVTGKKRKLSFEDDEISPTPSINADGCFYADEHYHQQKKDEREGKKKRNRTSFKHQQLRIMKNFFIINRNPDAKDLKELSELTGLTKRTLQVWFQNSRAKQRKTCLSSEFMSPTNVLLINNGGTNGCKIENDENTCQNSGYFDNEQFDFEVDDDEKNF